MKRFLTLFLLCSAFCWAGRGFNGTAGDSIAVPGVGTGVDLFSGPMTISFWMYPTVITKSYPLGKWNGTAANEQYLFCIGDATAGVGPQAACFYVGSFSALFGIYGGGGTLLPNHWYNIALRVDTGSTICGSPCNSFTINGSGGFGSFSERRTAGGLNLTFGCADVSAPTLCFNGYIAEVGFWNAPLSNGEIVALASGVPPNKIRRTSLVAYYPFYGAASPEPDLSGAHNNGAVTNTTTVPHCPCGSPIN